MENEFFVSFLLFVIAFLYSAVGHGGASGFLAVLGVLGYNITSLRFSALVLNVLVSSASFLNFFRKHFFDLKIFISLAFGSIPLAYIGARIDLEAVWYYRILALCLIFSAWKISGFFNKDPNPDQSKKYPVYLFILIGAGIGLISGLIGIGGGILLSPILLLLKATDTKTCSGIAALFVLTNSLAGIVGGFQTNFEWGILQPVWLIAAVLGGFLGAFWGSNLARPVVLRRILAGVLLIASVKMMIV